LFSDEYLNCTVKNREEWDTRGEDIVKELAKDGCLEEALSFIVNGSNMAINEDAAKREAPAGYMDTSSICASLLQVRAKA
jgi:hypothetical protein